MSSKVKRTYRLPASTVDAVRDMVERRHLADSQDSLVEMAIEDLAMVLRLADEAEEFASLRDDEQLRAEADELDGDFAALSRESWPR
jgi:hypothetical protein